MDVIVLIILDNNDALISPNQRISRQVEVVDMVKLVVEARVSLLLILSYVIVNPTSLDCNSV